MTRSLKCLVWYVRQSVFLHNLYLWPRVKVQVLNEKKSSFGTSAIPLKVLIFNDSLKMDSDGNVSRSCGKLFHMQVAVGKIPSQILHWWLKRLILWVVFVCSSDFWTSSCLCTERGAIIDWRNWPSTRSTRIFVSTSYRCVHLASGAYTWSASTGILLAW